MNSVYVFSICTAALLLITIFEMLRRRQLREKYVLVWVMFGVAIIVLAVWPGLLDALADALNVVDPVNLLLFGAVTALLLVCLHAPELGEQSLGGGDQDAGRGHRPAPLGRRTRSSWPRQHALKS